MSLWNPLIPYARECRDAIADEGNGTVSVKRIRARMWTQADRILKAVDLLISTQRLVDGAIRVALRDWPGYKVADDEYAHVDAAEQLTITQLEGIVTEHEDQARADGRRTQYWRDRLDEARLREQVERGPIPAEVESEALSDA